MSAESDRIVQQVATEADADVFCYAGPFNTGDERRFNECALRSKSRKNLLLILTTLGGSAHAAYQVVKSVRRRYPDGRFFLFIPSLCKSAGTLVAVGADELIMSDTAELGPLDIQLGKPDELGEFVSGLTPTQALDTLRTQAFSAFEDYFLKFRFRSGGQISTRMAADVATQLSIGLFAPIYQQLDPMRLGENARSNLIAVAYGQRIRTDNVKHETIERLVSEYPSHNFAIDRDEAKSLFEEVREPTHAETQLMVLLRDDCYRQAVTDDEAFIQCISKPAQSPTEPNQDAISSSSNDSGEVPATAIETDRNVDGTRNKVKGTTDSSNHNARKDGSARVATTSV